MSAPTVSIVIPTFNREALLPRALDSVGAQTFGDWEIVLVDDGSTDRTPDVVAPYAKRWNDRLVHIQQGNAGVGAARNRGIDAARGTFVAFLDSDDEFLPNKLERQLALFRLRPKLGMVYSDMSYVDGAGVFHESAFDSKVPLARQVDHEVIASGLCACRGGLFDDLIHDYFIPTIVGMVRRDILDEATRFPADLRYAEEWLFYLRVARRCRAGFVNEPLSLHHFVAGSLARTDPHRNTLGRYHLLRAIETSFPDLTASQRAALKSNLSQVCRQLGFDAYGTGDYWSATRSFIESFRHRRRLTTAWNAAQAALRSVV